MAVGLIVSRKAVGTVTEYTAHVMPTVSALRASISGTALSVLAVIASVLTRHVGPIVFGVVAVLPGIVSTVVAEVLISEARVSLEIVLRMFGNRSVSKLPIAGCCANDRSLLRLTIPTHVACCSSRH